MCQSLEVAPVFKQVVQMLSTFIHLSEKLKGLLKFCLRNAFYPVCKNTLCHRCLQKFPLHGLHYPWPCK